jgi:hypothetical protein
MDQARDGQQSRRLRAVGEEQVIDTGILGQAIAAVLEGAAGGLAPRGLAAAVADRLGVPVEQIGGRELTTALGVAVATGRVDEAGGRLVAVPQERREAG